MKKLKVLLFVLGATLLLSPLAGCGSNDYSGGSNNYYSSNHYRNDPWAYDRYYRSRVHRHHYRHVRPSRPNRPPARPVRPATLPARRR